MKRELYAIFKNGEFKEAALVDDSEFSDDVDRYLRKCERQYGQHNFSYKFGPRAEEFLPSGYEPRIFIPRPSNRKKLNKDIIAKYRKHAEDDGVMYE